MVLIALFLCELLRPLLGVAFQPFANSSRVVFRPIGHHHLKRPRHLLRFVGLSAKVSNYYVRFCLPGIIKLRRTREIELIMGEDAAATLQPFMVDGPKSVEPLLRQGVDGQFQQC